MRDIADYRDLLHPMPQMVTLIDVQAEKVDWLWEGRIPYGKITVLDGDPGLGKSTVTLDLAARVSTGRSMPLADQQVRAPRDVILISVEDGLSDTVRPRLESAGADLARIHSLRSVGTPLDGDQPLSLPGHMDSLRRAVEGKSASLLVIDPLMAVIDRGRDAHKDQDMRGLLGELAAMAEETHLAVLLVRHLNKAGGGRSLYCGGGSIGIVGAAALCEIPTTTAATRRGSDY